MGAAGETRKPRACSSEALPCRGGIVSAQKSRLCLESSQAALGASVLSLVNMSREDQETGDPALTLSLTSQVPLREFLPSRPQGLSLPICIMVGASAPQCLLGLTLKGFGLTGSTFPLLAKDNVYFATGPCLCRLTASSVRPLPLLDAQFWPVGDYDVK